MSESGLHAFWRQKAFLENPGLHKFTADVTVAGVVIVVFTRWHFEMYKNTIGQIKNTTNDYWGCFLVECVQETCNFLRAHSLEASLPTSTCMGDNREVIFTMQNG